MGKESKRSLLGVVLMFFAVIVIMILPSMIESGAVPDHGRNTSTGCDASVGECSRELAELLDDYQISPAPEPEQSIQYSYYARDYIAYRSLSRPPVCSAIRYASCLVPVRGRTRACTAYNRCKGGTG
ncbi:hypothetical protein I3842_03G081100 [Carya illinoinensis]|uniref:Uncharacterized protein n=1 Tax=Carya illinoinensis TaxID=32201 RepID=A0A922FHR9_CARIL|nr:hypothetical protein I3842_03G081100 [Carya illinoinensis]